MTGAAHAQTRASQTGADSNLPLEESTVVPPEAVETRSGSVRTGATLPSPPTPAAVVDSPVAVALSTCFAVAVSP